MSERTPLLAGRKFNALPLPSELSTSRKTLILGALWLSVFLGAADTTCVATLVTSISSSFQASNQASWLGTSYLLTLAAFTPTYGRLCDIYGRRIANTIALILFGVGTLGCGVAPSMNWLIVARCVAGQFAHFLIHETERKKAWVRAE
jgi:MFS family permease